MSAASEPAGENCPNGGQRIDITQNGQTATTYACNGADGQDGTDGQSGAAGQNGTDGQSTTVTAEPPGEHCARGGVKLQAGSGAATYVCNGDALSWRGLTADAAAEPNSGYLSTGSSPLTLRLPATGALLPGDVVRLVNSGKAAITVTPGADQTFQYANGSLAPWSWTARTDVSGYWNSVASSADGTKLVAADFGSVSPVVLGGLYTSTDAGVTWTKTSAPLAHWVQVVSSSDGAKLAAILSSGKVYTSADSGATWTERTVVESLPHRCAMASSSDGTRLVVATSGPSGGKIYTSADSGATWTETSAPVAGWFSVASSADGTKLVASVDNGQLYTSADGGATWTARETSREWRSVASSSDGTKLVAGTRLAGTYYSADSGVTWTRWSTLSGWRVALSADGTRVVGLDNGLLFVVDGAGHTSAYGTSTGMNCLAVSADGTKLVGGDNDLEVLFTSILGSLVAQASSSVELTYTGSGQFFVSNVQGVVRAP